MKTKTRKSIGRLILIIAIELVVVLGALYLYQFKAEASPKIGDAFTSGNEVMDRLKFSDSKTPAAKKSAIALFNSNRSNLTIVGSWATTDKGTAFKCFNTFNYSTSICPVFTNNAFRVNYTIVKLNDSISDNTRDIYQMVFIDNGKEIQPASVSDSSLDSGSYENIGEDLTFDEVKDGDDFVVIVYNFFDKSAIAFPFKVGSSNIYG